MDELEDQGGLVVLAFKILSLEVILNSIENVILVRGGVEGVEANQLVEPGPLVEVLALD